MVVTALEKAWTRRAALREKLAREGTNAFRVFTGGGEGIEGLVVDKYDSVVVLQDHEGLCRLDESAWHAVADWCLAHAGATSVYRKLFLADRSQALAGEAHYSPTPFAGRAAPA